MKARKKLTITDITPEIVSGVNAVLMARTLAEIKREQMDEVDRNILSATPYYTDTSLTKEEKKRITDPQDTYLMPEKDAKDFFIRRDAEIKKIGYDLKPGYCPACIADSMLVDAKHALIDAAQPLFGLTGHDLLCAGIAKYNQYIDLLCKLVVNMPGYKSPLN